MWGVLGRMWGFWGKFDAFSSPGAHYAGPGGHNGAPGAMVLSPGAINGAPGRHYGSPGGHFATPGEHFEGLGVHFWGPGRCFKRLAGRSLYSRCLFFGVGAIIEMLELVMGEPGVMICKLGAEEWGAGKVDWVPGGDDWVPGGGVLGNGLAGGCFRCDNGAAREGVGGLVGVCFGFVPVRVFPGASFSF